MLLVTGAMWCVEWEGIGLWTVVVGPVQPATEPEPAKTGPVRCQLTLDLKF